ncbi:MAG TPA: winged helix-turn-helix domain-containing protein [Methanomicrobiales archaeon]|nr:winged helix-turn-helix domain-containing protein [Methanomicrobiales archaeon]
MPERLFTSRTRVKLLELFILHPEREVHVREICRITGTNINAVRRELANLEDLGLLRSRRAGNARFYTVNITFPIYQELVAILLKIGKGRE